MLTKIIRDPEISEFLQKFQKLEKLVKNYPGVENKITFRDALLRFSQINAFVKGNFPLIEDLYSLRNVFSHKNRGIYIAKINNIALKKLDKIISELKNPPTVISRFGCKVFQTDVNNDITQVMKVMHDRIYTQVPVWDRSKLVGVFSYTSFFEWLIERKEIENEPAFTKKVFSDINAKYLNSPAVNFQFIPERMSIYEIPPIFEKETRQSRRLDCLLITRNGKRNEKVTGIITSWDLGEII